MLNYVQVNKLYQLNFNAAFASLDGPYNVISILTYDELLDQDIDIKDSLYTPCNVSNDTFNTDSENFSTAKFIKISSVQNTVTDSTTGLTVPQVWYIPDFILSGEPVFSMVEAQKLGVTIEIGVWKDADQVNLYLTALKDLTDTMMGTIDKLPIVYKTADLFMTDESYNAMVDARNTIIASNPTLHKQIKDLQSQLAELNAKYTALENVFLSIGTQS
jgi:hypothetical protein